MGPLGRLTHPAFGPLRVNKAAPVAGQHDLDNPPPHPLDVTRTGFSLQKARIPGQSNPAHTSGQAQ